MRGCVSERHDWADMRELMDRSVTKIDVLLSFWRMASMAVKCSP